MRQTDTNPSDRSDWNQIDRQQNGDPDEKAAEKAAENTTEKVDDEAAEKAAKRKFVFWIALGIIAWGGVLALGVFLVNHDRRQSLIIVASVLIFVGFWLAMLRIRRSHESPKPPASQG